KVDFVIFLTPQIIEDQHEMRQATLNAAGFNGAVVPNKTQEYARSELVSIDISPVEADIDKRFREMYQKSIRRK
ncbi:MAG: hypothetical protein IJR94_07660, partial [Synergistaceae bacterium]|nr:hypothetical protein [Synergistaceae bacterium]